MAASILFAILLAFCIVTSGAESPKKLVLKLVYHDSIIPPHDTDWLEAHLTPSKPQNVFLVNFSIGQPPIPQLAYMDTGSNLIWVDCSSNSKKQIPYNPTKSSTYGPIPCSSHLCVNQRGSCEDDKCFYNKNYGSGELTRGVLSSEQLTFRTSDDGIMALPDVAFGCSEREAGEHLTEDINGIFGLSCLSPSIMDHLNDLDGMTFSYCTGDVNNRYYAYNHLILGHGAVLLGDQTPLNIFAGRYYVTLEEIRFGDTRFDISPNCFAFKDGVSTSGVVIDTGSKLTYLPWCAYTVFLREVITYFESAFTPMMIAIQFCYEGNMSEFQRTPALTFTFAGGAQLVMEGASLFYQRPEWPDKPGFCVAVSSPIGEGVKDLTIIAILAQQFHNVGYDLQESKLYLQKMDCSDL